MSSHKSKAQVPIRLKRKVRSDIRERSSLARAEQEGLSSGDESAPTPAKLQFVDQGPELESHYANEERDLMLDGPASSDQHEPTDYETGQNLIPVSVSSLSSIESESPRETTAGPTRNATSIDGIILQSPSKKQRQDNGTPTSSNSQPTLSPQTDLESRRFFVVQDHPPSWNFQTQAGSSDVPEPVRRKVYAEYQRIEDSNAAYVPADELLSPAIWKKHFIWPNHLTTTQCTCLVRYYVEQLGPWLDIGDPLHTYTLIVPQRARRCPPLLNAIFTIAARHLASIPKYRNTNGTVQYRQYQLPRLDDGQAFKYHNASIAYLKALCNHPEHVQDEDLLAATVILRYYEEFDTPLGGERAETVMRPFQLFVAAQAYPPFFSLLQYGSLDFSIPGTYTSMRQEIENYLHSYQHASFRIALRQECARAFLKQQPIGLDLQAWSVMEGFDEADDFVWTDRHLYHLARVLQFCFDNDTRGEEHIRRWEALTKFEELWEENKPFSFAAIHYKESNGSVNEVFPEIWHLSAVHALAVQYLDLSRILLAVYNPTVPRLGPGAALAQKKASTRIREAVLQLCGIAVSMPACEPILIQSCMAIAVCGEHISARLEQDELVGLLVRLQEEHGLETSDTVKSLKQSWSR